jgi:EmrB/QacA subfamily drug resistance transporter
MAPETQPYARRWQALGVLALSLLVITMGNTILNVALPTIRESLDATSSQLQWISDGYLLVFAGLLLAAGSLGDRFGRRRALVAGLTVFGAGSLFATFADSATTLIAARAVMGLGAAFVMPTTLSILTNIFPAGERPKAIAAWAAVSGIGVAIGPTSGGWLLEHFDYSSVFLINLPIVAAALAGAALLVPESRDPDSPRIDYAGAGLSIAGLSAIVWGLIEAPERGWGSPTILGAFAAGAAILAAFMAWEQRTDHPMLDVSVFRNLRFSAASLSIGFVFFALMGVMYFMTQYMQTVLGFTALETGIRVLPIAGGMVLASKVSVALSQRLGTKLVVAGGLGTVAAALWLVAGFEADSAYAPIGTALGMMGLGIGLAMSPATEAIMGSLPRAKAGIGSAMNDVVREVGGTLGIAVLGSLLTAGYRAALDPALAGLPAPAAEGARSSVAFVSSGAIERFGAAGQQLAAAARQAYVDGVSTAVLTGAAVLVAAAAFVFVRAPHAADLPAVEQPEPATADR